MKFFNGKKDKNYTIIAGCGRLGAKLAGALYDGGSDVMIIDNNDESFRKIPQSYGGISLLGDATEISTLNEADVGKATAVVAVTNNDNTNILVAQIAKEVFGVPHVIARLYDPEKECVYHELGIDTICPAVLSAKEVDRILNLSGEIG